MMLFKKTWFFLLFLIITPLLFSQTVNKTIVDEETDKQMLIGITTREAFSDTSFAWWFNSEYEMYEPDSSSMEALNGNLDSIKIIVIMGSWCSDSRREVPRLLKVLDSLDYNTDSILFISVNRDKYSEEGNIEELALEFVPTFIFYKNNREVGRIQEMPDQTVEKDMVRILKP